MERRIKVPEIPAKAKPALVDNGDHGPESPENSNDIARKLVEAREREVKQCAEELSALLSKYKCALLATPVLTEDGRVSAKCAIAPQERMGG